MTHQSISIEELVAKLNHQLPPADRVRQALASVSFVGAGYGSIARPLFDRLLSLGVRRFSIVDPKSYVERSVHSQCEPGEVGRPKVAVGAERLGRHDCGVRAFDCDLYEVPDGIVDDETIVIASLDNRRGDIGANRLAARNGGRLVKINIEPDESVVAVRAYDFRSNTTLCAECQFSDRHYEQQRHPRSCDGPGEGRHTNSPRWLSEAAAQLGTLVAIDMAVDEESAQRWMGCEWQYRVDKQLVERSLLSANENCRWDHDRRWKNVERLSQGPEEVGLRNILGPQPNVLPADARVRFCQSVALGGACRKCGRQVRLVRWTRNASPEALVGFCSHCGSEVGSQGYWKFSEVLASQLARVWNWRLADWGVEPHAVISLQSGDTEKTFVVGNHSSPKSQGE